MRALVLIATAVPLFAGLCSPAPANWPRHEFQFFAGYSPASSTLIGTETDRRFITAGFTYEHRCWIWNSMSLSYTGTLMPAAILLEPRHAVYGFGIAPLGFTLDLMRTRRIHPFVETIEGLIASTEPIPETGPDASGLNFLIDLGGGIRWSVRRHRAVTFGYRFLHISNAGTTDFNPGVDNNVFYVGYSFLR